VILNYVEGYARVNIGNRLNFLENFYGSLKETQLFNYFCFIEKTNEKDKYDELFKLADEIGAMLWKEITNIERKK
jgi:four helix bundle protein